MSLLSSHRLHWGSHHEVTDHFWIIIDRMMHDSTNETASTTEQSASAATIAPLSSGGSATNTPAQLEVLGP